MPRFVRKFFLIALPAFVVGALVSAALVEAWVRVRWDQTRGTPGFYVSDPVRGQRLAPNYRGWFAGVPVQTNALGFRDNREYSLDKGPGTFRILVFGDSVTFGHGTLSDTTYPFLLERRLKQWRPAVKWEVWNLGVPGYNTGQELEYLREVGPRYQPDLVIIGFYPNDFTNNEVHASPSLLRRAASAAQRTMQRYLYSYEFYKRVLLTARWALLSNSTDRLRIQHLAGEDELLAKLDDASQQAAQQLTDVERFSNEEVRDFVCPGEPRQTDPTGAEELRAAIKNRTPEMALWVDAVREFQRLNREGAYRLMFFINMAPKVCLSQDRFFDLGALSDDDLLLEVLGEGAPVASSTREFMHYRPSQMPAAGGHSVGNANRVKADVLFEFLRSRSLIPDP